MPAFDRQRLASSIRVRRGHGEAVLATAADVDHGTRDAVIRQDDSAMPVDPFIALGAQHPRLQLRRTEIGRQVEPAGQRERRRQFIRSQGFDQVVLTIKSISTSDCGRTWRRL